MQNSAGSGELVYGGNSTVSSPAADESHVMSEKVQSIASSIYAEFETIIQKHGQDSSIKDLMSLVVSVLESLDVAYQEKEEFFVDLEMLREENEQLLSQFERERQTRKNQEQKWLEMEETLTEQNRDLEGKIESMASIVRMLELKAKNASDHATRLEEREADQKSEFGKLHDRYNELLRTHVEHVERSKFLMGAEMADMAQSLPFDAKNNRNNNMAMSMAIDTTNVRGISDLISAHMSQSTHTELNLANHISNERDWHEEFGDQQSAAEILATPREQQQQKVENEDETTTTTIRDEKKIVVKSSNNEEGDDAQPLGADLTGQIVDPAEFASAVNDTFIGMGKEIENLIQENTELLETKNALNIVKNDLIAKVDKLSSEQQIFREEVRTLELVRMKLTERCREMEGELKGLREKNSSDQEPEDRAQGKRYTRVEMARMVLDRNQYKEKFLELQDTMKFMELKRASKKQQEEAETDAQRRRSGSIWNFFSSLLGENESGPASNNRPMSSAVHHRSHKQQKEGVGSKSCSSPTKNKM